MGFPKSQIPNRKDQGRKSRSDMSGRFLRLRQILKVMQPGKFCPVGSNRKNSEGKVFNGNGGIRNLQYFEPTQNLITMMETRGNSGI